MYETAVLGLVRAIEGGAFPGRWEFHGIGTVDHGGELSLTRGARLKLLPKQDIARYRGLFRGYDVGLSLMYTPHPSLVPIEMAAAGMVTVTNTYANKTASQLLHISPNFVPVEPTVEGVAAGLAEAATRTSDHDARVRGSAVRWSTTWEQAFNPRVMQRLAEFLQSPSARGRLAA
jgi:hypothetical protein